MVLKGKVAVIYGVGGAIGGAIARAFAAEGVRMFLTGHSRVTVEAVAKDIGKATKVAEIDALDEAKGLAPTVVCVTGGNLNNLDRSSIIPQFRIRPNLWPAAAKSATRSRGRARRTE